LRGLRNRNIEILKKKFDFKTVTVRPDHTLAQNQIKVRSKDSISNQTGR
jgi:hypothetical protein